MKLSENAVPLILTTPPPIALCTRGARRQFAPSLSASEDVLIKAIMAAGNISIRPKNHKPDITDLPKKLVHGVVWPPIFAMEQCRKKCCRGGSRVNASIRRR